MCNPRRHSVKPFCVAYFDETFIIRAPQREVGQSLRDQPVADLVGVSRTPIRSALDLLAERGVVETRKNQGFFLRKAFDTLHRIEIEIPSTIEEELYSKLVRDRLENLIPNSVTQSEIARRYDADRVAVTRTLLRLGGGGAVIRHPRHGRRLSPPPCSPL